MANAPPRTCIGFNAQFTRSESSYGASFALTTCGGEPIILEQDCWSTLAGIVVVTRWTCCLLLYSNVHPHALGVDSNNSCRAVRHPEFSASYGHRFAAAPTLIDFVSDSRLSLTQS